jgi:nicotinate-nucleotide adenylyltransferase
MWLGLRRNFAAANVDRCRQAGRLWQHKCLVTGLFGGTFDPIHNAHLAVARAARDAFSLDRVLLIPAAVPPHKLGRQSESWFHRFRMVQIACAGERGLDASDLEAGAEHSYSIHTIERLKAALGPKDQLRFIIGADAFDEIQTWYRWRDVVAAVEFIVVTRPGHSYSVPDGARIHPLGSVHMDVSSSQIRHRLASCEQPSELPPAVFDYIRENRLYGYGSACR